MHDIVVRVCGDHWVNSVEVEQNLKNINPSAPVRLDLCAEGPSLGALGILTALRSCCELIGRDPASIVIDNWHNTVEVVEFTRLHNPKVSHFFWMSDTYRHQLLGTNQHQYLMAFFVGRATLSRAVMMWELYHTLDDQILLSLMHNHLFKLYKDHGVDSIGEFLNPDQILDFQSWWNQVPVTSLDGHSVRDQYDPAHNTNRDLIQFYPQFDIEVVAETYTRGITFFPTEKTVRPLAMGKASIVYGPANYLQRLKKMGFQTWDSIWDESYDVLEGPARWRAISALIKKLYQQERNPMLEQITVIGQHNQRVLQNIIKLYQPR
jgi:hypothetical protein